MIRNLVKSLLAAIIALQASSCGHVSLPADGIPFDAEVRRKPILSKDEEYPRLKMARDLISSKILHGKKRSEVLELLGEPWLVGWSSEYNLAYWLGPDMNPPFLFACPDIFLLIGFDREGVYCRYRLKSHD